MVSPLLDLLQLFGQYLGHWVLASSGLNTLGSTSNVRLLWSRIGLTARALSTQSLDSNSMKPNLGTNALGSSALIHTLVTLPNLLKSSLSVFPDMQLWGTLLTKVA